MPTQSFWSRVTDWFKADPDNKPAPKRSANPTKSNTKKPQKDDLRITKFGPGNGSSPVTRMPSRPNGLEKLEQGYEKLVGLVDNLNSHFQNQNEGTERMVTAVRELSDTISNLSRLPDQIDNQQQVLSAISTRLDDIAKQDTHSDAIDAIRTQLDHLGKIDSRLDTLDSIHDRLGSLDTIADAWTNTAEQLPQIAESHRESLEAVRQQFETSNAVQERVADSMETLHQTVTTFGNASASATETLQNLQAASVKRDNDLIAVLQDQNKKFTALMLVGIVVAVVMAAGVLIIALAK